jgi:hypothetical protein
MLMNDRKSNLELAKDFYAHNELAFRHAATSKTTEERQFAYSDQQFDEWAVAHGHLPMTARDAADLEHGGILFARNTLRRRMNLAARRGDGLSRAFTVEARAGKWRVVLLERFVAEQPTAIVRGIQQCLERSDRTAEQVKAYLSTQEHLTDEDQLRIMMRLDMAQMFVFNGLQMMELMMMGIDAANPPNLKRLRRKMAQVLLRETTAQRRRLPRKKPAA